MIPWAQGFFRLMKVNINFSEYICIQLKYHKHMIRGEIGICTSNHMFGTAIWDKVHFWKFSKIKRVIYPKNRPNQTCDDWLITPNQQTLCSEANIFQQWAITNQRAGNYKITPLTVQYRLQSIVWLYSDPNYIAAASRLHVIFEF